MADVKFTPPSRSTTSSSNATPSHQAAARYRLPQGQSIASAGTPPPELRRRPSSSQTLSPHPPEPLRRRSSLLSDATNFTEDLINPSAKRQRHAHEDEEVTHWHSTPLAFALLPAIGGLLFKNGSAFTTDVLLLGLAAVFMNWSIRIPWDWYYSAQAVGRDVEVDVESVLDEHNEIAVETASSVESSPQQLPADGRKESSNSAWALSNRRREAAADLRRQEILALLATFLFPALAAYLLHVIRAQLSRPSTGLVSDYNLSIFLLAAEIRPARQLVRLVANRTLHLQRLVNGVDDVFSSSAEEKGAVHSLTTRIAELEAKLSDHALIPSSTVIAQKADVTELSAEMRKRYEPRLEGLERAVRRYEKRSTTLAMLTEQRLNSLETRLQDALSLAAVAAQHSQKRGGIFSYLLETVSAAIALPMKLAWAVCIWPFLVVEDLYDMVKVLMLGPAPPSKSAGAKRRHAAREGSADEKQRIKSSMRKVVR